MCRHRIAGRWNNTSQVACRPVVQRNSDVASKRTQYVETRRSFVANNTVVRPRRLCEDPFAALLHLQCTLDMGRVSRVPSEYDGA